MIFAGVGSSGAKMKVLVVDDTSTVASVLEAADCDIVVGKLGENAHCPPIEHDFAVCIISARTDGLAIAAAVHADPRGASVPIILIASGDPDPAYVTGAYTAGVADVLRLPVDKDILRAKVAVYGRLHQHRQRDVARREAEYARLQAQFLATLGQELRPPLNTILGWIRMLRDGSIREPQRARALETVERSAQAQLELIEEMLDVSRMTDHALTLDLAVVDVRRIVEEVVEVHRPAAIEKQVTLFAAVDDDVAAMSADADRLRQIVDRLVKNAVASTPTEGVVTVSLRNADASVELAITDSGASNEANVAPRAFDGYAVVRHLIELHDGSIAIEDAASGVGRRFVVNLPPAGRPPRTDDEAR